MASAIVFCVDGSELSLHALRVGYELLDPGASAVIVTVAEALDEMDITGTGMAGGTMSPETFDELTTLRAREASSLVQAAASAVGAGADQTEVLTGDPGPALCKYAADASARAVVIGSRGRGGITRALLGSVSDHVVRHAPCPVLVVRGEPA
jgi:nucleotide-binding universal stress UspA family protein